MAKSSCASAHTPTTPANDRAIESLLGEITTAAYFTESLFQKIGLEDGSQIDETDALRNVIARMGWLADLALKRMDSINCMREGRAEEWLLSPRSWDMLKTEAQA